jgi:hypothetical protein
MNFSRKLLEQLNSSPNVPEEDYEKLKQELIQVKTKNFEKKKLNFFF